MIKQINRAAIRAILVGFGLIGCVAQAQVASGTYPFGTFDNHGFDAINVGNLNVHFSIPVLKKGGRGGLDFNYNLGYDNSIWYPSTVNGSKVWTPVADFGWSGDTQSATGYISYAYVVVQVGGGSRSQTCIYDEYLGWTYHDRFGISHFFNAETVRNNYPQNCGANVSSDSEVAEDGSGYTINISNYSVASLVSPDGKQLSVPVNSTEGAANVIDPNGNEITASSTGVFTDTTGNPALSISGTAPSAHNYTYTDTSGNPQSVSMTYKTYTVQTAFNCTGVGEYGPMQTSLVDAISFPDGTSYQFTYEPTPQHPGNVTGRLATVQLPQGGVIHYGYSGGSNGVECSDGSTAILTRALDSDSGSASSTWTYTRSFPNGANTNHTEVVDGLQNHKAYDFVQVPVSSTYGATAYYLETNESVYQGAENGTPVLARSTCYNGATVPCITTSITSLPVTQIDIFDNLDGLQTRSTTAKYNKYGAQTEADIYDFSTSISSHGPLLKQEVWTYGTSIPLLATEDDVYDGAQQPPALATKTTYTYDGSTPVASSGVPQHVSVACPCGNLTGWTLYASSGSAYPFSATFEDTGSVLTSTSPNGTTTFSYDPTFVYQTGVTFPTPSSGVTLQTSATFDSTYTGLPINLKDYNAQQTSYSGYNSMLLPTKIQYPDGGSTQISYESAVQTGIDRYQNSSVFTDTEHLVDGYARPSRTAVSNGKAYPNNWYQQDVCYDGNGNQQFSSYPYQAGGFVAAKICTGSGDVFSYDVLGRLTQVHRGTGEIINYSYLGRATKSTDENGVSRISQIDGLGRPSIVCEMSSSTLQGVSPTPCGADISGTGFTTTYAYTLFTPTTTVTQGAQTRTFQTDWLGRPTSVTEPESGTTTYSYSYNSTGLVVTRQKPKANQSSASVLTTTTYQYDSMARLLSVTYDDGTRTKTFTYDASAGWSDLAQTNLKGRLSMAAVSGNFATTIYSYDAMGRISDIGECLPFGCGTAYNKKLHYTYDWEGNILTSTDGNGVTSTYTFSPANELTSLATSSLNPTNLVSNVLNGVSGPVSFNFGNGLSQFYSYDSPGRLTGGWVCNGTPSADCSTHVYDFTTGWKGVQLQSSSDSVLNQISTYGYDEFNRLASRTVTSGTIQNFTYAYDRYGNRAAQTALNGGTSTYLTFNSANNQVVAGTCNPPTATQYCYDAAGNMTADSFHTYAYDADGNVSYVDGSNTALYGYDALNHRVSTKYGSTIREFVFDQFGRRASAWDGSSRAFVEGQYYWDGEPVAYYDTATHFQHQDWLGTERMRTAYNYSTGGVEGSFTSLPFGDAQTSTGIDTDVYHFAALDYDAGSLTDHAQFRQYSNNQGRWFSPDPFSGSYDFTNAQTLNRYTYVQNNPLTWTDIAGTNIDVGCWLIWTVYNTKYNWGFGGGAEGCDKIMNDVVSAGAGPLGESCSSQGARGGMCTNSQPIVTSKPAPNNAIAVASKIASCTGQALKNNGVALVLDAAGFIPGESILAAGAQTAVATASFINSAYHQDAIGAGAAYVGSGVAPLGFIAKEAGFAWAKAIPFAGYVVNGVATAHDLWSTGSELYSCATKP